MKSIIFLMLVTFTSYSVYSSPSPIGKVAYQKGKVWVNKVLVKKNTKIFNQQLVRTGAGALVVLKISGGSTIKLSEKSSLKLNYVKTSKKEKTLLVLLKGSVFTKLNKGKGSRKELTLKTRTASLGVRGTEFFTSYGKDKSKDVWMCVNEGQVHVKGRGERKGTLVNAGEGVVIRESRNKKKSKTSKPKALPWTKKLNWELDYKKGDLVNHVRIEEAYAEPLDEDYD